LDQKPLSYDTFFPIPTAEYGKVILVQELPGGWQWARHGPELLGVTTQVSWPVSGTNLRKQDSIIEVLNSEACPKHSSGADTDPGLLPAHSLDVATLFWRPKAFNSMDTDPNTIF